MLILFKNIYFYYNKMDLFYSEKNKDLLYNLVRDDVYRKTKYNIDEHKKYYNTFGEIMKIVFKHSENRSDLNNLNKAVLGKSIPYLVDIIKQKQLKTEPLIPKGQLNNNPNPMLPGNQNVMVYGDVTNISKSNQPINEQETKYNPVLNQQNNDELDSTDFKIENSKEDIYNNNINPMDLFDKYNLERSKQDDEYKQLQDSRNNFENNQALLSKNVENNLEEKNQNISLKINELMNNTNITTIKNDIDEKVNEIKNNQDMYKKDIKLPTAIDNIQTNKLLEESKLFEELKKSIFTKKKYINRETFISINSGDRDWYNNSNENRFNFQVKFDSDSNSQSASIPRRFKNIVSFEIIRSLLPIENIDTPFNTRIYLGIKSLPYLLLKIDEIDGLYSGTNSNSNNAFCKLLWDKDNGETIYLHNYTNSNEDFVSNEKPFFERQYKRGYCLMAPLGFEKKTYYPSPLASLDKLTLNLLTPFGHKLSQHPDVMSIKQIKTVDMTSDKFTHLLLNKSNGFPYNASDYIIEITTTTFFSLKKFKIGDNIILKGIDTVVQEENDFFNRPEGHYIINLEKLKTDLSEDKTNDNEGFSQLIYIAVPTDIDYSHAPAETMDTSYGTGVTYGNDILKNSLSNFDNERIITGGDSRKLINQSMQSNYIFKVTVREEDATEIANSINI